MSSKEADELLSSVMGFSGFDSTKVRTYINVVVTSVCSHVLSICNMYIHDH